MSQFMFAHNLVKRVGEGGEDTYVLVSHWVDPPSGAPYKTGEYNRMTETSVGNYIGWDIPDFHKRFARGELLPHTPWYSFNRSGQSNGTRDYTVSGGGRIWSDPLSSYATDWILTADSLKPYIPDVDETYVTEAMAKIYGQGWDALTFVAEFKQVVRMFKNVARGIARLDFPRNWRDLNNSWLSTRYGWRVLIYDIVGLNTALFDLLQQRTRFSERSGTTYSTTFDDAWTTEHTDFFIDHTIHDEIEVSLRGSVTSDIEIPFIQFNPLQTAWELIPFSFVIDWVLNVGRTIAGITYACRAGRYTASAGYQVKVTRTYHHEIGETKSSFVSGLQSQTANCTATIAYRQPSQLSIVPHFIVKLNCLKVLDFIALILQRI